jgi:membrane protease YdiL (CAAX protease family)
MSRWQALVDVVLALALTVAAGLSAGVLGQILLLRFQLPLLLVLALQGVIILAGLHALLLWRRQSWRDMGLVPFQRGDVLRALQALLLVFAVNIATSGLASQLSPELVETHKQGLAGVAESLTEGLSLAVVAAIMLFVGFYEELLARGFLLRRSRDLLAGIWGPVLLSSFLFGLGHFYQGWYGVVQTALVGVVFARLTLRWGTLWPAILAHAALNTLSLAALRELDSLPT